MNQTFDTLVCNVSRIHEATASAAKGAVNQMLTVRNWLIGHYIVEYEQHGNDRAAYGTNLLQNLAERIAIKGLDRQMLNTCRLFYQRYPQIRDSVMRRLRSISSTGHTATASLPENVLAAIPETQPEICDSASRRFELDPEILITKLSFTHIRKILPIDDPFERFFYELECIRCGWSVRELDRQISSQLCFRAGVSQNPEKLLQMTISDQPEALMPIKSPYVFEFLGLNARETVSESDLEQAIMDHLQEFLLEMGKGFCFEARQKRIVIDGDYYFADLVLYNRLLHCNVIIELKVDKFRYEYFGQLNSYVSYYRDCEMTAGDNPPIGILLCTEKGPKMVEYVLNGMDEKLFISTYMLQLPDKKQLREFLLKQMEEMGL